MNKFFCLIALFSICNAENPTQKEMLHDLEVARYVFETKYAPQEWKRDHFGWSLENSHLVAKNRIIEENPQTIKEYQKIFKEFILSTNDHHVNVKLYSTARSWFPLSVVRVQNRYFISKELNEMPRNFIAFKAEPVDLEKHLDVILALQPGDEILEVDGKPVGEIIEEILLETNGTDRSPTSYAIAEKRLFKRHDTTTETFKLLVRHKGKTEAVEYTLPWMRIREWIKEQPLYSKKRAQSDRMEIDAYSGNPEKRALDLKGLLARDYSVNNVHPWLKEEKTEKIDIRNKGNLPPLGKVLWETDIDKELYAYLYRTKEGRKIGYLYLESFDPADPQALLEEIVKVTAKFQKESDALIVDITNNTGGDLFFAYAVLSTLADKPLLCPKQRETLIQEDLFSYLLIQREIEMALELKSDEKDPPLPNCAGFPLDKTVLQQIRTYVKSLLKTWESGNRFTEAHHLIGISKVKPHPKGSYKKPIIVLTNELCFSCSDIFAAMMQDNKRALIFGQRTAGAGGYVRSYQHSSRFGIASYTITGSIVFRSNGSVLENLGVTPDIPYKLTLNDVQNNYSSYKNKLNSEVNKLLKKTIYH